jgi:hypothetical protein
MGTGLDAAMQRADCGAEDGLSTALGAPWSSGTALHGSSDPDGYAAAPDHPLFEPRELTLSAWVISPDWHGCGASPDGWGECSIVAKGNTDEGNGYWLLVTGGRPRLTFAGAGSAEHDVFHGESRLDTNVWYHLVGTFDGTTGRLYVDGVPGEPSTVGFEVTYGDERFLIGGMINRNFNHIGHIEEVKLWHYAKTAAEVAALYHAYLACPS